MIFHFIPTYSSRLNLVEVLSNLVQARTIPPQEVSIEKDATAKLLTHIECFSREKRVFQ